MAKKKVVVGMSGGVDSSVAAYLLKEMGYDVIGVTMKIWQDDKDENSDGCCGLNAALDARRVADELNIPHYVLNFKNDFKEKVIDYFIAEYIKGYTPNPCIACNRYIKWESMLKKAMDIGADCIATGHYAKIGVHPETNRYSIIKSVTDEKDQSYALYNLTQYQLERTLMPVGEYSKPQIREIATKLGLLVADKKDSQEICFVEDGDYAKFITENAPNANETCKPGNFVDTSGNILGRHKGILHYTIGQRKGLGLSLGKPIFVKKINKNKNEIVLSSNEELYSNYLKANNINFMYREEIEFPIKTKAKIRYSHKAADCEISYDHDSDTLECFFDEPQRAITPGQAVVFYDGDYILCGGTIL